MTLRRAAALAANLPPTSAVWRVLNADGAWSQESYILAALFDRMGSRDSKPYPRPVDARKQIAHELLATSKAERFLARQQRQQRTTT